MSSMNFNPFQNWFEKQPNPVPSINFVSLADSFFPKSHSPNFASIGLPKFSKKSQKPETGTDEPGPYKQIGEQFLWECENIPDDRNTPEVDKIFNEDPIFEKKVNPSAEEIEAEEKWWERFCASPVVQFMARAEEIADDMNKMELEENDTPYLKSGEPFLMCRDSTGV
ncbi:Protein TIC 56 [Cardamine amara subsp. amara]|uniref:Protein TIC 56 n=1 Tax=Cardamine amara subsp. amara TaxID=228776 RepID=A0ABD1B6S9_CARAN